MIEYRLINRRLRAAFMTLGRAMRLLLAALISLLIPLNAVASVTGLSLEGLMSPENMLSGRYGTPTPPPGSAPTSGGDLTGQFSMGLLFEDIGEDRFLTLYISNQLEVGPVKFGLQVPVSCPLLYSAEQLPAPSLLSVRSILDFTIPMNVDTSAQVAGSSRRTSR